MRTKRINPDLLGSFPKNPINTIDRHPPQLHLAQSMQGTPQRARFIATYLQAILNQGNRQNLNIWDASQIKLPLRKSDRPFSSVIAKVKK